MAELRADIVSEFKGKKAFKEANTATSVLQKGVKRLGAQLAVTFGATQLLKFAKNAAKAFIEDEKAASQLAISVKNLGLAFETPRIEAFISAMAKTSGVADDMLRPSMQKLLTTTGSVAKSQELLTQALDISRGSGIDFETVVKDLTMAYVGQTRGLRKYSLGLTQADLKTMSFADVQAKLTKQFTGANAQYLTTYAGKIGILSNAAAEASETIGKSLVESLSLISGSGNTVQPLADSMEDLSIWVGDTIYGLGIMVTQLKSLPGIGKMLEGVNGQGFLKTYSPIITVLDRFAQMGAAARPLEGRISEHAGRLANPANIVRTRVEKESEKRAKALAALQKKSLDTQKKQNALTKASKVLDLDRISVTAALRGQISETDRLSLQLQLALLDKNESQALKLSAELTEATKRQNDLKAALLSTPEAPNPYRNWMPPSFNVPTGGMGSTVAADYLGIGALGGAGSAGIVNVIVNLDGDVVGGAVTSVQQNQSLSGTFADVSRYNGRGAPSVK